MCVGNILTFSITFVPQFDRRCQRPLGSSLIGIGRAAVCGSLMYKGEHILDNGSGPGPALGLLSVSLRNCKFTSQASIKYRITTCLMSICLGLALTTSCLSVRLYVGLFVCLSLTVCLFVNLSVCLSLCLSLCISVCLFVFMCMSVCSTFLFSVGISVFPCVCLSVCL